MNCYYCGVYPPLERLPYDSSISLYTWYYSLLVVLFCLTHVTHSSPQIQYVVTGQTPYLIFETNQAKRLSTQKRRKRRERMLVSASENT